MADRNLMFLSNLQEFLEEGHQIVTYKWLGHTLNVSSDVAKKYVDLSLSCGQRMLYTYWRQQNKKESNNVSAVFLVSGIVRNSGCLSVLLVDGEHNLEESKSQFISIWSVHIYSLQTGLKKRSLLFTSNSTLNSDQLMAYPVVSEISLKVQPLSLNRVQPNKKTVYPEEKRQFSHSDVVYPRPPKLNVATNPPNNLEQVVKKTDIVEKKGRTNTKHSPSKDCKKNAVSSKTFVEQSCSSSVQLVSPSCSKEKEKDRKIRKRMRNVAFTSDSGSDDDSSHVCSSKATVAVADEKSTDRKLRKRVRKLKSKMYTTADGAMVTEKYYESESTDVSGEELVEVPLKVTNTIPPHPKGKLSSRKKLATKQQAITSFFKRK